MSAGCDAAERGAPDGRRNEAVKTSQIERELLDRCADNRPSTS